MKRVTVSGINNGQDVVTGNGIAGYKVPVIANGRTTSGAGVKGAITMTQPAASQDDIGLTEAQLDEIQRQYGDFDLDGDGLVQVDEFVSLCEHIGVSRERAFKLSSMYDEDGDGTIDLREFKKRNLVSDLEKAVERRARDDKLWKDSEKSHVNVAKILQVVRAKIDNSRIAFAFGRYMVFVIIYVYVAFYQRNPNDSMSMSAALVNYFVTSQYRSPDGQQMISFSDITNVDQLWDWHEMHFIDKFFVERYYNDAIRNKIDSNAILEHNKLTGGFRMTQRRVKNSTCFENAKFKAFTPNCFAELSLDGMAPAWNVEKAPFSGAKSGEVYTWKEKWVWDNGYYEEFDQNRTKAKARLAHLREDMWIGPATQWYRLDFVMYNPNVGIFAFAQFTCEMHPTGLFVPKFEVTTRRNGYYLSAEDWIRLALEVLILISWIFYMYGEYLDAKRLYKQSGRFLAYFSEFWNAVDILHLLVFLMLIATWIYIINDKTVSTMVITESSITMPDMSPLDFTNTAMAVRFYFALHGFNMLVVVIRILKFLRQNAYLGQLTDAFELMRPGLMQFAVVLFIVIFMFTAMGVILFGSKISDFTNFLDAIDMVMGYTVGYADPLDLFEADPTASIFFYYPFTFLMAFFVLPLTIAVIMDGYGEMQAMYEAARTTNLADVINLSYPDQLYRGFIRSMQVFIPRHSSHPRLKLPSKHEVLRLFADLNKYDVMSYNELKKMFRDKSITEEQLEDVIKKYNAFQPDPEWQHLIDSKALEERNQKEEEQAASLTPLIEQLQLRADQIVRDQQSMQRKLDLLCEIFPAPAPLLEAMLGGT